MRKTLYGLLAIALVLGVAHFGRHKKLTDTKFHVGDCFSRPDLTPQGQVTGVEKYVYNVKWLTEPTDNPNIGIEEKFGFTPIRWMDNDDQVYRIDCDVTTFSLDSAK